MFKLTLTTTPVSEDRRSFQLSATVTGVASRLSPKVFVYQAEKFNPMVSEFRCVATLEQLHNLPEDAPTVTGTECAIPFFRRDHVDMLFAHAQDMEEAKAIIEADIDTLIADAMAAQSGSQTLSKEYNV